MGTRAVVLGGGGPVGIAWESGLISGLAKGGVDFGLADFIMGTSAGSFVGARLAQGEAASSLVEPFLKMQAGAAPERHAGAAKTRAPADMSKLATFMAEAQSGARPAEEVRAELGAWALQAETVGEQAFIESFGQAFSACPTTTGPSKPMPARRWIRRPGNSSSGRRTAAWGSSAPWLPVAACRGSIRRSPSAESATWTAACGPAPTPTWRPATTWW